jgi:ubiquinone/menaquinone biosynthesis C-methylase UbiE
MSAELAGQQEGVPERFAPGEMRGQLIEAEHLARYRWASALTGGKRVLDAGCGTAYGTAMLAEGDAREVIGVDNAESVLESVRDQMPSAVRLEVGDLRDLPYPAGSFDLVVCFEVVEHFEDPFPVLDELTRVLSPEGILVVSSPNPNVYPPGNPHHHHEFLPQELVDELGKRLRNVSLMRQHAYITAAIFSDERLTTELEKPLEGLPIHRLVGSDLDHEIYTLALASNGELPETPSLAMLTSHLALREWTDYTEIQERTLEAQRRHIDALVNRSDDREKLQALLIEAERRIHETEKQLDELKRERQLILISPSWKATKPLRAVKRLLGRNPPS